MNCRALLLSAVLFLSSCAAKNAPSEDCEPLFTLLPANFIIDLAAGSEVSVDPAVQEFPLFCSSEKAFAAMGEYKLPGDWRVYMLEGSFAEKGSVKSDGSRVLTRPATVLDWVPAPGNK